MTEVSEEQRLLEAIEHNTREIADWLQLAYGDQMRDKLEATLSDDKKKLAYQHSHSDRTTRQVANLSGTSHASIQRWWDEWSEARIVEGSETPGRFRRRYDLVRLGIALPSNQSGKATK